MNTGSESINIAFAGDSNLRKRIFDAINEIPRFAPLFDDIAKFQLANQQSNVSNGQEHDIVEQPSKKRKLEEGAVTNGSHSQQSRTVILEAKDVSFTLPQRKKLHLSIVQYGDDFNASTTNFGLCGNNPATSQVEFEYPISTFAYALRVAVPEKAQKQYNFCFLSPQSSTTSNSPSAGEAVIWTVNHGPLKSCQIFSEDLKALGGSEGILEGALDTVLRRGGNRLIYPNEVEFVSALVESHRKNDKAYHVKAFRGSKDGYLFFLENGIFFGFKKPLAFFSFEEIDSVSYTAVLQRTFNLIIVVRALNKDEQQEIEFSMIDQADFAGIDAYVKKHQLQDASMAETRRAKKFNVNNPKGDAAEAENNDGETELQKAEQELEDEEDEMEEDYDPGSEGESEGSGSDDDDDEYDYTPGNKGKDLVKDELGSEAEDVEITDGEVVDDEAADDDEADEEEDEEVEAEEQIPLPAKVEAKPPKQPVRTPLPVLTHTPAIGYSVPDINDEDQL